MENKITQELIEQAKAAKNAEELKALARENGLEMTDEEANAYFEQLHVPQGELQDEELENVSGGACKKGGRMVVTAISFCSSNWKCKNCGSGVARKPISLGIITLGIDSHSDANKACDTSVYCKNCKFCTYEKGLWLCNNKEQNDKGFIG